MFDIPNKLRWKIFSKWFEWLRVSKCSLNAWRVDRLKIVDDRGRSLLIINANLWFLRTSIALSLSHSCCPASLLRVPSFTPSGVPSGCRTTWRPLFWISDDFIISHSSTTYLRPLAVPFSSKTVPTHLPPNLLSDSAFVFLLWIQVLWFKLYEKTLMWTQNLYHRHKTWHLPPVVRACKWSNHIRIIGKKWHV